jgi:hypothetical protein
MRGGPSREQYGAAYPHTRAVSKDQFPMAFNHSHTIIN